jgi:YesN/AraC family two-component response regulator
MILRFILSLSFELYFNLSLKGEFLFVIQSLIWLIVFIKIIFTPEILFGIPKLQRKINPSIIQAVKTSSFWNFQKDSVPTQKDIKLQEKIDDNILNIVKEIDFLCIDQHFFRNQKVNILELSKEMNIPLSHLIYVFKYHCNVSFTEYKTHIKIEDAKKLIESGFLKSNTLESLAINVGFSSYNPFFTAFKKLQGMSPNEYSLSLLSRN